MTPMPFASSLVFEVTTNGDAMVYLNDMPVQVCEGPCSTADLVIALRARSTVAAVDSCKSAEQSF